MVRETRTIYGALTTSQLMEKIKDLQNTAYQLGIEESRQMTRGMTRRWNSSQTSISTST